MMIDTLKNFYYDKSKRYDYSENNRKYMMTGLFLLLISYIVWFATLSVYDSDLYFLVATGREVLENGPIYYNPWFIIKGVPFVAQQWIYAVVLSFADGFGYIGLYVFLLLQLFLLIFVLWQFFGLLHVDPLFRIFSVFLIFVICNRYIFNLRPEVISLCLLLLTCVYLEKWSSTGKSVYLLLPVIFMILEVNLHSSFCGFHFCLFFAYLMPSDFLSVFVRDLSVKDVSFIKHHKDRLFLLFGLFIALITASFINPYGYNGALYLFNFFKGNVRDKIFLNEFGKPYILSFAGLGFIVILGCLVHLYFKKRLSSVTMYVSLGFLFLSLFLYRNSLLFVIAFAFIFRDMFKDIDKEVFLNRFSVSTGIFAFLVSLICCVFGVFTVMTLYDNRNTTLDNYRDDLSVISYIINDKDASVFTGFNTGAYFEYKGYKNIYMDARPELFTSAFTHGTDYFSEYTTLFTSFDSDSFGADISSILNKYDFEYFVVEPSLETYLFAFLNLSDDYVLVDTDTDFVVLFKRI